MTQYLFKISFIYSLQLSRQYKYNDYIKITRKLTNKIYEYVN